MPFKIHARAVVLVLFLSAIVGSIGVSAMPHGPAVRPTNCETVGAAQANAPDVGVQCVSPSGSVLDAFSRVFDEIKAIHATVETKAETVASHWNDLNDFINRVSRATPTN